MGQIESCKIADCDEACHCCEHAVWRLIVCGSTPQQLYQKTLRDSPLLTVNHVIALERRYAWHLHRFIKETRSCGTHRQFVGAESMTHRSINTCPNTQVGTNFSGTLDVKGSTFF